MSNRPAGRIASILATWFGCGRAPVGPGTAGAAGALAVAFLLVRYAGLGRLGLFLLAAALTPVAIWAAGSEARSSGRKDPGHVVIDEVLGQWIALLGAAATPLSWGAAFVLFRVFDIYKPPPVRQLERLPGGLGIVADDLMAGAYSALVLFGMGCFNLY